MLDQFGLEADQKELIDQSILHVDPAEDASTERFLVIDRSSALFSVFSKIKELAERSNHGGSVITLCAEFDKDGDRRLSQAEFQSLILHLGFVVTDEILKKLFSVFDVEMEGSISYFQFIRTISYNQGDVGRLAPFWFAPNEKQMKGKVDRRNFIMLDDSHTVKDVFGIIQQELNGIDHGGSLITVCDRYDSNGDKRLNESEFGAMLRDLKFELSDALLKRLYEAFELDVEGTCSYFDFIEAVSYNTRVHPSMLESVAYTKHKGGPEATIDTTSRVGSPTSDELRARVN